MLLLLKDKPMGSDAVKGFAAKTSVSVLLDSIHLTGPEKQLILRKQAEWWLSCSKGQCLVSNFKELFLFLETRYVNVSANFFT